MQAVLPKRTVIETASGWTFVLRTPLAYTETDEPAALRVMLFGQDQVVSVLKLGQMSAKEWARYYAAQGR